jgi:hypothetical protein
MAVAVGGVSVGAAAKHASQHSNYQVKARMED